MPIHLPNQISPPRAHAQPPAEPTAPEVALTPGRAHEICGAARRTLTLWIAARYAGPVLWIAPSWDSDMLHSDGVWPILDPARLITLRVSRAEDLLWSVEEALRSGAVPLVVACLPAPPALTPVRRLHLAAQHGGDLLGKNGTPPLALLLTPGQGGAPGVESRWHMQPDHLPAPTIGAAAPPAKDVPIADRWRLHRTRARGLPPKSWLVTHPVPMRHSETADTPGTAKNTRLTIAEIHITQPKKDAREDSSNIA